jgi:hypothetical protein
VLEKSYNPLLSKLELEFYFELPMLLELTQMDERETHFREVFLFGVLQARGVCKAERPSQS